MCQWQWPHPIELCHYRSGVAGTGSQQQRRRQQWGNAASEQHLMFAVRPWDPSASRADASHLMPVLTPVRPVQNTSTSVTRHTRRDIYRSGVCTRFRITLREGRKLPPYESLFEKEEYFHSTSHFSRRKNTSTLRVMTPREGRILPIYESLLFEKEEYFHSTSHLQTSKTRTSSGAKLRLGAFYESTE